MASLLPVAVVVPYISAAVAAPFYRRLGRRLGWAVAVVPLTLFVYFSSFLGDVGVQGVEHGWSWVPALGIRFSFLLDGLGLLFALLVTGIGLLVVVYSTSYLGAREDLGRFYAYLLVFMGAMLGVVLSDNLIALYASWELTSVSSFLLIGFWHTRPESRDGALKSLLVTVLGGFALLVAFLVIFVETGTFQFSSLRTQAGDLVASPMYPYIVALLLLAAFTKSAQAPFHFWLPSAMAAPTPVSAYLHSATMVKAGIFLVAKFSLLLGQTPLWYYTVAAVGATTMLLGAALALRQTDLKALLAFSTVSQLGFIMPLFALGTAAGAFAGAAHIVSHATFKGALFLLVGVIDHATHTRDITRLRGLRRRMPITAALMGLAALSMAGVWPLNGFVSKELIFAAMLHPPFGADVWTWTFLGLVTVGSVCTTAYSLVLAHRIHFGHLPDGGGPAVGSDKKGEEGVDLGRARDGSPAMMLGPVILVFLVILLGAFPSLAEGPIYQAAAGASLGRGVHEHAHNLSAVGVPLMLSVIAVGFGVLLYTNMERVQTLLGAVRYPVTSDGVYRAALIGLSRLAAWLDRRHMTGFLRDYVAYILAALIAGLAVTLLLVALPRKLSFEFAPIALWEGAAVTMIACASVAVVSAVRRLAAVVALGVVGATMSLLFVMMRAPDLALTQLLVEAVSTVLILLAFARLPAFERERMRPPERGVNIVLAVGTGLLVSSLALLGHGSRLYSSISSYYVEHSLDLGGGRNIVNVILVDFRGLDTMGEITVLAIAALSVKALISLRSRRSKEKSPSTGERSRLDEGET